MRTKRTLTALMLCGASLIITGLFMAGSTKRQPVEDWERAIYNRVIEAQSDAITTLQDMTVTQRESWHRYMRLPRTGDGQPWLIRCAAVTAIEPNGTGCVVCIYGSRYETTASAAEVEALVWDGAGVTP